MNESLRQALQAIQEGDEDEAKLLLAQLLKEDPDNVHGWVLLSRLASSAAQKRNFLDKILAIDPEHVYARQELQRLDQLEAREQIFHIPPVPAPGSFLAEATLKMAEEGALEEAPVEEAPVEEASAEEAAVEESPVQEAAAGSDAMETVVGERAPDDEGAMRITLPISEDPLDYDTQARGDTLPPWMEGEETVMDLHALGEPEEQTVPELEIPDWLEDEPDEAWSEPAQVEMEEEPIARTSPEKAEAPAAPAAAPAAKPRAASTSPAAVLALSIAIVIVFMLIVYVTVAMYL